MKRFRLLIAAAVFGLVTTACSSDLVGPNPSQPSYDGVGAPGSNPITPPPSGQGGFGSGG
jgi:hypothetical protein